MTDAEQKRRAEEQNRAIDLHRPSGAMVSNEYLERRQQIVGVNITDLEDMLYLDRNEAFFGGFGIFCLSGSIWIIAENVLVNRTLLITPLTSFCIASTICGITFLVAAVWSHMQKRGRIDRIFSQTQPTGAKSPGRPRGKR